jgi:conjugative coupling factor TraD (TOL family)
MSAHELDQRLRPAVEGYSAAVAAMCASVAFLAPWALMLPPSIGAITGSMAAGFAAYRGRQAWQIVSYRYGMTHYKLTRIAPHKIPSTQDAVYLGHGFDWGQQHTQRKMDAATPDGKRFLRPTRRLAPLLEPARRFEAGVARRVAAHKQPGLTPALTALSLAARLTSATAAWNPLAPTVDLGGTPILHGVEPKEAPILLRQNQRNGHMLVLGTTRVGKTRLLELLATQDIHAGRVVIVIDPKGDADLMMRIYAEAARAGRLSQLYLFHLGYPEISARYNGIGSFSRITEVASRATNALPSTGNSAAFKEFSWRFTNLVAQAQVALGRVPTYESILRDITNIEPLFVQYAQLIFKREADAGRLRDWENRIATFESLAQAKKVPVPRSLQDRQPALVATYLMVKELRLPDPVLDGLATAVSYEKTFFEKIIASLGPFLEKLTTGSVGKLLSPDYFDPTDTRPVFDWMTVIRQGGIVYAGLDALSDSVISSAVGNSMLADLVSVGGKLYKEGLDPHHPDGKIVLPTICGHFDEVNELVGPEFVPMVNKLGGSGFQITAYTQTIPDIEARVGDKARAEQILGNFNHVVMLRVKSLSTAKFFTDQLPRVDVVNLMAVSGVTDTAADGAGKHFTSQNQDRVGKTKEPMLEPSDIMQLPQGQAFALIEGNRLKKIRMPLPDATADALVPSSIKAIGEDMRSRYRSSEQWASQTDWLVGHPIGLAPGVLTTMALPDAAASLPDPREDPGAADAGLPPGFADLGTLPRLDGDDGGHSQALQA